MKSYREREHTSEQQERIENDPLSTELKRYRREHNLTVDSLSSFFEEKGIKGLGASTIKKYEAGSGKPSWETTVLIADALGVSCDRLMRGVDTPFVDACRQTGLSQKAVHNLTDILSCCKSSRNNNIKHHSSDGEPKNCSCFHRDDILNSPYFHCPYRHVLPIINEMLEDMDFLSSISKRTQKMLSNARVKAKVGSLPAGEEDIEYGIKFALMESFYAHIRSYLMSTKSKGERKKPDELSEKE